MDPILSLLFYVSTSVLSLIQGKFNMLIRKPQVSPRPGHWICRLSPLFRMLRS